MKDDNILNDLLNYHLLAGVPSGTTLAAGSMTGNFFIYADDDRKVIQRDVLAATEEQLKEAIDKLESMQIIVLTDHDCGAYNPAVAWRLWEEDTDGKRKTANEELWQSLLINDNEIDSLEKLLRAS